MKKWELKIEDSLKTELPICDLIFFDTDHNYNQLSQELKLHGNKSRKSNSNINKRCAINYAQ